MPLNVAEIADQDLALARRVRRGNDALPLHLLHDPRRPVIPDLQMTLDKAGRNLALARHDRHAEATRRAVQAWGLEILCNNPAEYSSVLTAVMVPDAEAQLIIDWDVCTLAGNTPSTSAVRFFGTDFQLSGVQKNLDCATAYNPDCALLTP